MLHKCANPDCLTRFLFLGRGRLFQIESDYVEARSSAHPRTVRNARPVRRIERYWLCDECASILTLTFDQTHGVVTVPLPEIPQQRILTTLRLQELGPAARSARATHGSRGFHEQSR
jgi:hypothetical protein